MKGWGLGLLVWGLSAAAVWAARVVEVRVEHAEGASIDPGLVLAHVSVRAGDEFDRGAVSRDVKAIQDTKTFSFVSAHVEPIGEDFAVVYVVHPRPTVRSLRITGAQAMSNRAIRKLLDLGFGDLVDESLLAVRAQAVTEAYRKKFYPNAQVSWEIREDTELRVADVEITVDEGKVVKVKSIRFTGNDHLSAWALRKVMVQKQLNPLSFLTRRGGFSEDDLAGDLVRIRRAFLEEGFLDVRVGEPEVTPVGRNKVTVVIPVEEGPEYRVRGVEVEGVTRFPPADVQAQVASVLGPGDVASIGTMEEAAQAVRDYYGSRGHVGTRVIQDVTAHPGDHHVTVTYRVQAGSRARVRSVDIRGNERTQDKVIRRELTVFPGEIYNSVKIRTSERRLRNLGYFSFVNSSLVPISSAPVAAPPDDEETYDLVFEVEEQRSGQFAVGAGFSSIDDVLLFAELSQGNFDIGNPPNFTGGGQKFRIRLQLGTERRDWQVSFTEPWFLDQRLSLGFDVFQHERRFLSDDYDQLNTGGSVSLTRPLRGPYRLSFTYSLEEIEVQDVDDDASDRIKAEEGARIKSAGALALLRDTRDSYFIPTRGSRTSATATLAGGPFAGETDLYELSLRTANYYPLWFDHVFSLRGQLTFADVHSGADRVPIFDRLFLGGARTLRGFDYRDVGPKDENGEPLGGLSLIYGTAEYTVPLFEPLRAATFFDLGMVYEDPYEIEFTDWNSDVGIGLRLDIPGFPIQLDYAWPLEADEFNDRSSGRFNFWIGYTL